MTVTDAATFCATLVDEWVGAGLRAAMVAPGSRSTPMALALLRHPAVRVEVFHDERSAAFAALGYGLSTGVPAVVLCSSGTAAVHFHAAVVEADLSGVPMLVLTADRPAELRDVAAAQTIDQTHLYGRSVRWFHDPGVPDAHTSRSWRPLARRAWRACIDTRPGPVHLNLPFREPLVGDAGDLPPGSPAPLVASAPVSDTAGLVDVLPHLERQRGVIVAGRGAGDDAADRAAIARLSAATGWPVLADPRSRCRHLDSAVWTADSLLRHDDFARAHVPEVVLHVGEPWASRVLNEWLVASGAYHVHVSASSRVVDPGLVVSQWVVGPVSSICGSLAESLRGATGTTWAARWRNAEDTARQAIGHTIEGLPLSEPAVARAVLACAADGTGPTQVMVSSSMPIRDVEWYAPVAESVRVFSNRGANGIDGVVATATGIAIASGPVAVLIGDVAFLHDSSSLTALRQRGVDVRIVVVDNDGGGIFSFLPQATAEAGASFETLFGTPHGTDLAALCSAHHLPVWVVDDIELLRAAIAMDGPRVIIVKSDRSANVLAHRTINERVVGALR